MGGFEGIWAAAFSQRCGSSRGGLIAWARVYSSYVVIGGRTDGRWKGSGDVWRLVCLHLFCLARLYGALCGRWEQSTALGYQAHATVADVTNKLAIACSNHTALFDHIRFATVHFAAILRSISGIAFVDD